MGEAEIEARSMTDNPRKGTMDSYRCELCGAWVEHRDLGKVLAHQGPLPHDAPGINAVSDLQSSVLRAAQRPRWPRCQACSTVQRVVPARPGFEHWTLRCMKCGHIHEAQVQLVPHDARRADY